MVHLIDKDALVAEIERLISNGKAKLQESQEHGDYESYVAWSEHIATCGKVLSFLNTLEVKEVDLEEKATQLSQKYFPDEENIWARSNIEAHKCKSACIEMVEWLNHRKENKYGLFYDTVHRQIRY